MSGGVEYVVEGMSCGDYLMNLLGSRGGYYKESPEQTSLKTFLDECLQRESLKCKRKVTPEDT